MTLTILKKNFHKLIDEVNNKDLLDQFYRALSFSSERKEGMLWDTPSDRGKKVLLKSYEESKNRTNLVSHDRVMQKYQFKN